MSRGEYDSRSLEGEQMFFGFLVMNKGFFCLYSAHLVTLQQESRHAGLEVHFSTTADDGVAHVLDDGRQTIGTEMRMCIAENRERCPMLTKYIENLLHITTFLAAGIEFSVGESTSSTLTERIVRFRVNHMRTTDLCYILTTFMHILPSFDDNGTDAKFDKPQGSKQSTGTRSHNNGTWFVLHTLIFYMWKSIGCGLFTYENLHLQIYENSTLTGIDTAFQYAQSTHIFRVNSMLFREIFTDILFACCLFGQNAQLQFLYHSLKFICKDCKFF